MDKPKPARWAPLRAIARGKRAWSRRADLERAGHRAETLDALIDSGWLAAWPLPGGEVLTLTPYAAARLGLVVGEHREPVPVEEERVVKRRKGGKVRTLRERVKVRRSAETPHWEAPPDDPDRVPPERAPRDPRTCPAADWLLEVLPDLRAGADPVAEAIRREDEERAAVLRGQAIRDPETGRLLAAEGGVARTLFGRPVQYDPRL